MVINDNQMKGGFEVNMMCMHMVFVKNRALPTDDDQWEARKATADIIFSQNVNQDEIFRPLYAPVEP